MRIVFLTYAFQHPQMRGSARQYHFIRELARRHEISLLALSEVPVPGDVLEDMESLTRSVEVFETGVARSAARLERRRAYRAAMGRMRTELARLHACGPVRRRRPARQAVAAGLEGNARAPARCGHLRCGLDAHPPAGGNRSASQASAAACAYAAAVLRRERGLARATPYVSFISARDRDAVVGSATGAVLIPNGVDLEYWRRRAPVPARSRRLVFTGVMDYGPNEDAALLLADEVLPLVQKQVPEAEVVIVGRDPRPALRERSERADVTVTGFVEDVRPYLDEAAVFVAPIRFASGQQNKVLEAMALEVGGRDDPGGGRRDGDRRRGAATDGARPRGGRCGRSRTALP